MKVLTKTRVVGTLGVLLALLFVAAMLGLGVGPAGLPLTDVNADSPAGKGGLKAGDVIIKFGDIDVADIQESMAIFKEWCES